MARVLILPAVAGMLLTLAFPAAGAPQMSAGEQASVQQAVRRGALMYAYDRAAWIGTDDMLGKIKEPAKVVGGWIVDGPPEAPELIFFDKNEAEPRAIYVAQFRDQRLVSSRVIGPSDDRSLSAERKRMIAAQRTAVKAIISRRPERCTGEPFNTVTLPPAAPGEPALVYFLTPQTDVDALPFGGHYLVEVSAEGEAAPARAFSKSCLNMPFRKKGMPAPAAIGVSHLLDPVPTEIHVFSSLAASLPVMVITTKNRKAWMVTGSGVEAVDPKRLK